MIVLPMILGTALGFPGVPAPASAPELAATPPASLSALTAAAFAQEVVDEDAPDGLWHGALNVGLSRSEGNANVENYSIDYRAIREFEQHRYTLEAFWYMARDNDRAATDRPFLQRRALGMAKYDQFISETMYLFLSGFMETNFRAALDLRWSISAGVGQQWRDDGQWKISTEVGLAYFDEEFDNGDQFDYLAARLAWDVWTQVTDTLVFGHFGEAFPSLDDKDDFYGRANTYLEAKLSETMLARLSWVLAFDNTPAEDPVNAPARLERADNVYLLTVGWTF